MAWSVVPHEQMGAASARENAARDASAMQFFRGLRDHASLIARASHLVFGWLSAAVAAGDGGRAVRRAAGDLVKFHLAAKTVIQADDGHAEMQQVGDNGEQRGF